MKHFRIKIGKIRGTDKKHVARILTVLWIFLMMFLYQICVDLQYFFCFSVIGVYILFIPKKLLNPKNIVFFFYVVWYVIAPLFASRYTENMQAYAESVNQAFLMCFITYAVAMVTLDICIGPAEYKKHDINIAVRQDRSGKMITWTLFFTGLIIFIHRTGGLALWLSDANRAYFSRRGSGAFYLLFTLSLTIIVFFEGQKKAWYERRISYIPYYGFCILFLLANSIFIGSKGVTLLMFLMMFCEFFINENLVSKKTILLGTVGCGIFFTGMYVRLGSWRFVFSWFLNYFTTFENFGRLIKDYEPGWFRTVFMPLLWPLAKLGILSDHYFYDFNIWLTTKYFPDSWYIEQGTEQWNLESDLYLSFHYYWGIPLIILYFAVIAFLYRQACCKKGIWKLIYINEAVYILSHLRGGLLIYWYWYLIPLYIWLVMNYDRTAKIRFLKVKKYKSG